MTAAEPIVFVVDDDPSMRRALERTITSAGWVVQTYGLGETFLDAYDPSQPGCVVLELRMPQISGLAVQEQLEAAQGGSLGSDLLPARVILREDVAVVDLDLRATAA